jgi:indole-3-glycerol phosphate synthase/phosphoribosylanthranilate isomerase
VKILSVDVLRLLIDTGRSYGMEPLVEIADEEDLQKVLQTDAKIIGINNRDLRDFSVDISRTFLLAKRIPSNRIVISLSGFFGPDVRLVKNVCNGVLVGSGIGSQLSTNHYQLSIQSALSRFISPNPLVKFCGVRTEADFDMAKKLETPLLGINFVPTSKRCISEEVAGVLSTKDPGNMRIVGVFQDQSRDSVQKMCSIYKLDFAQLSGDESPEEYADFSLPIIKGISMTDDDRHLSQMEKWDKTADVFLFDGKNPGSGESWVESSDLQTIRGKDFLQNLHKPYVIAGGICPENAKRICDYTSADGVDTASGIEDESGEWSLKKMIAILSSLGQKT